MSDRDPAMERARKRARELRDYYSHLFVYVVVCAVLVTIDLATGSAGTTFVGLNWAYWPIMGWGIAVAFHTVSVIMPQNQWEERKTKELYEREQERHLLNR